ncbi:transcription termination/antitermination NusG family protein [Kushneria sp. AK178]
MTATEPEGLRWYGVQCKSGDSFRAVEHLRHQGYTVFHPVIQRENASATKPSGSSSPCSHGISLSA